MDPQIKRFTNELMRLTDDLDHATAFDFVTRVHTAGLEADPVDQRRDDPED